MIGTRERSVNGDSWLDVCSLGGHAWEIQKCASASGYEHAYLATDREVLIVEAAAGGRTVVLDPPRPLLMVPPAMGKSWTWSPRNLPVDIKVTDRWVREETVRVPAGTFRTWKVESSTVRGDVKITIQTWYALGVGVVKVEREQVGAGVGREGGSELISYRIP